MNNTYKIRKFGRAFVVTIPEEIRRQLRLKAGDRVYIDLTDANRITVRRANQDLEAAHKRRYCGGCAASLTSCDFQNGACTQCGEVI